MFYAKFIKLCNKIGKSPSAVAEELGFKKSAVTRWKQGSIPTDGNKQKIADFFGVSVEYLTTDSNLSDAVSASEPEQSKSRLRAIARLEESQITPEQDELIADFIDILLKKKKEK